MRRRTVSASATAVCLAAVVVAVGVHRTTAQAQAPSGSAAKALEPILSAIGHGQFDDAVGLMDGLKTHDAEKEAARAALVAVRDAQLGSWHGYDVATTVRFSPRLQTLDVLGYFDVQPVLYRFQMYEPTDGGPWQVLEMKVDGNMDTADQTLRNDAAQGELGRGGRLAP